MKAMKATWLEKTSMLQEIDKLKYITNRRRHLQALKSRLGIIIPEETQAAILAESNPAPRKPPPVSEAASDKNASDK